MEARSSLPSELTCKGSPLPRLAPTRGHQSAHGPGCKKERRNTKSGVADGIRVRRHVWPTLNDHWQIGVPSPLGVTRKISPHSSAPRELASNVLPGSRPFGPEISNRDATNGIVAQLRILPRLRHGNHQTEGSTDKRRPSHIR
jgi:hypothetical protein